MMLPPGSTIGILGGGQLGRMTAMAAARLGYRTHVFATEQDAPAVQVAAVATIAPFGDAAAVARFAAAIDVATFEFENIPRSGGASGRRQAAGVARPEILEITQDRAREEFSARDRRRHDRLPRDRRPDALAAAARELGAPAILKTGRLGYDGKGQVLVTAETQPDEAWHQMGGTLGILEGFVDFRCEISVVLARAADGAVAVYPPVENRHVNHILDTTIAPASLPSETLAEAEAIARQIAERLDLVGVLAVEMFVTKADALLVNELAPRPHNSGHWTIDACTTSQFEQLVRAICGLPLGSTERHADAVMNNLIGHDVERWREALDDPQAKLHLYGKTRVRPGRKMGHITRLLPRS
jgi:5-(carboxyamino)imidazole ribonucleotide synthase